MQASPATKSLEAIPDDVVVVRPQEVLSYLERHGDLGKQVVAMCLATREEFGRMSELVLEVYHDPEMSDHYLHLLVRPVPYDPKVMDRIDAIRDRFDDVFSETSGWFLVTSDFGLPKHGHGV